MVVKICQNIGSFGAPLEVETSVGFLDFFLLEICQSALTQVESWTFDSLQIGASCKGPIPIGSMYIFTYIWLISMVNVGKYSIHGSYGF